MKNNVAPIVLKVIYLGFSLLTSIYIPIKINNDKNIQKKFPIKNTEKPLNAFPKILAFCPKKPMIPITISNIPVISIGILIFLNPFLLNLNKPFLILLIDCSSIDS